MHDEYWDEFIPAMLPTRLGSSADGDPQLAAAWIGWQERRKIDDARIAALEAAANEVLRVYMPQFNDSRAVDDCLVGLAAAVCSTDSGGCMADENDVAQETMTPIAAKHREDVEWFNQRLANARLRNSQLEGEIARLRVILRRIAGGRLNGGLLTKQGLQTLAKEALENGRGSTDGGGEKHGP